MAMQKIKINFFFKQGITTRTYDMLIFVQVNYDMKQVIMTFLVTRITAIVLQVGYLTVIASKICIFLLN